MLLLLLLLYYLKADVERHQKRNVKTPKLISPARFRERGSPFAFRLGDSGHCPNERPLKPYEVKKSLNYNTNARKASDWISTAKKQAKFSTVIASKWGTPEQYCPLAKTSHSAMLADCP